MMIETFKYIGSVHLLPHISITYDSTICDGCVSHRLAMVGG
jgi:hypothetical protein